MFLTIYYCDSVLLITSEPGVYDGYERYNLSSVDQLPDITKLLQNLQNNNSVALIYHDPHKIFEILSAQMRLASAAGGVVSNSEGDVLMIFRNGRWDLPKGHIESGEQPEECAVREVEEECGVSELTITGKLTTTYHIYPLHGEFILKEVFWYSMRSEPASELLIPQVEEGITSAEWVKLSDVGEKLKNSYYTIVDVFDSFLGR